MTETNRCIFGPLLSPLHDGELADDRRREVLEHLRGCEACSAELADIRRFGSAIAGQASASLPAVSDERLDELFAASLAEAESSPDQESNLAPTGTDVAAAERFRSTNGEVRHLRYVRLVSGVAAAVFLVAIGRLAYQQIDETDPRSTDPLKTNTGIERPAGPETQPFAEERSAPLSQH